MPSRVTVLPDELAQPGERRVYVDALGADIASQQIVPMRVGVERAALGLNGATRRVGGIAVVVADANGCRVGCFGMRPEQARQLAYAILELADGEVV